MMCEKSDLRVFLFEGAKIRTVGTTEAPLFCAKDVCDVLGLSNASVVVSALDEDERSKFNLGRQGMKNMVTESGLYHLIFKSRKAAAKKFRRWITDEVLPSLRKKGFYSALAEKELITLPEWLVGQGVDLRSQKLEAKRLLKKAWEASRLLGYREKAVDERSGLVMFSHEVLDLAEDGDLGKLELKSSDAEVTQQVLELMEPEREYSVEEIAEMGGFSGSVHKLRSEVGTVMGRILGVKLNGCTVDRVTRGRRKFYVMKGGLV